MARAQAEARTEASLLKAAQAAKLRGATLKAANPKGATLEEANPTGATLKAASPRGATLKGATAATAAEPKGAEAAHEVLPR